MKKFIISLIIILFSLICIYPASVSAMNLSVGVSCWYSFWDDGTSESDVDPALLYGPLLSLKLNEDFSLSTIFLYGTTEMHVPGDMYANAYTTDMTRLDSDTGLSYRLNSIFKAVAGFKYMWFDQKGTVSFKTSETVDYDVVYYMYGPALGINATVPLGASFYLNASISGMYLWWEKEATMDNETSKGKSNMAGANTNLSLMYYIPSASTTLALGGRYQPISSALEEDDPWGNRVTYYGITFTAIYTF